MRLIRFLVFLVLSFFVVATAFQNTAIAAPNGHFSDAYWANMSTGYTDLAVNMTINESGAPDGYFYALNGLFKTNDNNIYGGLQTNGYDGTKWVGKMAIFSIWNAEFAEPEPGAVKTKFSGEGVGMSVRIPYNWQTGVAYNFKMYRILPDAYGFTTWAAKITNLSNGAEQKIGKIFVPTTWGNIYRPVTFHERYNGSSTTCSGIGASSVTFSNMSANGGSIKSSTYSIANNSPCPNQLQLNNGAGVYTSKILANPPVAPKSQTSPATPKTTPAIKPTPATITPPSTTLTPITPSTDNQTEESDSEQEDEQVWEEVLGDQTDEGDENIEQNEDEIVSEVKSKTSWASVIVIAVIISATLLFATYFVITRLIRGKL